MLLTFQKESIRLKETWNGFEIETFEFEGKDAHVVFPALGTANGRLVMKMIYWGEFPNAAEGDLLICSK